MLRRLTLAGCNCDFNAVKTVLQSINILPMLRHILLFYVFNTAYHALNCLLYFCQFALLCERMEESCKLLE